MSRSGRPSSTRHVADQAQMPCFNWPTSMGRSGRDGDSIQVSAGPAAVTSRSRKCGHGLPGLRRSGALRSRQERVIFQLVSAISACPASTALPHRASRSADRPRLSEPSSCASRTCPPTRWSSGCKTRTSSAPSPCRPGSSSAAAQPLPKACRPRRPCIRVQASMQVTSDIDSAARRPSGHSVGKLCRQNYVA